MKKIIATILMKIILKLYPKLYTYPYVDKNGKRVRFSFHSIGVDEYKDKEPSKIKKNERRNYKNYELADRSTLPQTLVEPGT